MDGQTHTGTDKPKAICPLNFFQAGGIKKRVFAMVYHGLQSSTFIYLSFKIDQNHFIMGILFFFLE